MGAIKKLIPNFLRDLYHQAWPFLGAIIYGFPGKKIKVIGITGTNGKTTVTHLATDILEGAGYKAASISSLRFKIGDKEWKNELKMTMPGRMKLQKFLRQALDAGCEYVVMEVTSEGIGQHRHKFIDFDVAVFTNLTPEHIEAHGSFENYKKVKGELFKKAKISVVNLDDKNRDYFLQFPADKKYGYSIDHSAANRGVTYDILHTTHEEISQKGISFQAKDTNFNLSLLGKFNISNALAAICVGLSQGVDLPTIKKALEKSKGIPGRMEVIVRDPFTVIVDYAHTPDSLEKVYEAVRNPKFRTPNSKLICVLGAAGGGRDKWKRPALGKIAAHYCDEIILTDEDPYEENPETIISQIESGVRSELPCDICGVGTRGHASIQEGHKDIHRVLDRREAIKKALQSARPGDAVVITGKGAEPWMMVRGGKIPWDDREIVRSFILQP